MNVLSEENRQQVLALGRLGWSLRPGSTSRTHSARNGLDLFKGCRHSRATSRRLGTRPSKTGHRGVHRPWTRKWSWDENRTPASTPSASACEPYREFIEAELAKGRNAMAIWQDLVDGHGFAEKYASVKRFVRKVRGSPTPEARVVIGDGGRGGAQVDYGTGPMVRDPQRGKYRRTRLFVMTLGYSRKSIRLLVCRSSSRVWAELHEKAFRRLGGVPRMVVLDNLREGVLTPDIYEPTLNPLYRDVLQHYGVTALPCRVQDPDRKAYVSYCTLSGPCNVESWLLGTPTSLALENGILVERFV